MRFFASVAVASVLVCVPALASANDFWCDDETPNGYCSEDEMSAHVCDCSDCVAYCEEQTGETGEEETEATDPEEEETQEGEESIDPWEEGSEESSSSGNVSSSGSESGNGSDSGSGSGSKSGSDDDDDDDDDSASKDGCSMASGSQSTPVGLALVAGTFILGMNRSRKRKVTSSFTV